MRLLADPPPLSNPNFLVTTNHIFSLLRQLRQAPAALRFRQTPAGSRGPAIKADPGRLLRPCNSENEQALLLLGSTGPFSY